MMDSSDEDDLTFNRSLDSEQLYDGAISTQTDEFCEKPVKKPKLNTFCVCDSFSFVADRYARFIARHTRLTLLLIFIPLGLGIWGLTNGVQVDYGINAFKVRDHPAAEQYDAMSAAVTSYQELRDEIKGDLSIITGLNSRKRGFSAMELLNDGLVDADLICDSADLECLSHAPQNTVKRNVEAQEELRTRNQWHLQVLVQNKSGTVFTPEILKFSKSLAARIMAAPSYQNFCLVDTKSPGGTCASVESLLPFFFPPHVDELNPEDYESRPTGDHLTNIERAIDAVLRHGVFYYTDKNFSKEHRSSELFRMQFAFGSPLPGFESHKDRLREQEALLAEFMATSIRPILNGLETGMEGVTVLYGGDGITEREILLALTNDASLASIALLFIFFLLWATMHSLFLALMSSAQILLSVPAVFWVYNVVFGIQYVGVLNAISLFLIIGVGVDDCFIFYNTFMQLANVQDLGARLSMTYRRATKATFITSFTTAAAFAVNLTSAIPALRLFAIFMSLLVMANYALVILWFPAVLGFWHTTAQHWTCTRRVLSPAKRVATNATDGVVWIERLRRSHALYAAIIVAVGFGLTAAVLGASGGTTTLLALGAALVGCLVAMAITFLSDEQKQRVWRVVTARASRAALAGASLGTVIGLCSSGSLLVTLLVAASCAVLGAGLSFVSQVHHIAVASDNDLSNAPLPEHYRAAERVFAHHVAPFVLKYRRMLVSFFFVTLVFGAIRASQLRPTEDLPQFFTADSNIQRFLDWKSSGYYRAGSYSVDSIDIKWGCDDVADSGAVEDVCGVCDGDCTSCITSCDGQVHKCEDIKKYDLCGICGGDNTSCRIQTLPPTPVIPRTLPPTPQPTPTLLPTTTSSSSSSFSSSSVTGTSETTSSATTSTYTTSMPVLTSAPTPATTTMPTPAPITSPTTPKPTPTPTGCDGVPNSSVTIDQCGVCGGNNECVDCNGIPHGTSSLDQCGVCDGDNDCIHTTFTPTPIPTQSWRTAAPTPAPIGCDGIPYSAKKFDRCGVCGGTNACIDCKGVINGTTHYDVCGDCGGDGTRCIGCTGEPDFSTYDLCGVCNGNNDCMGCDGSMDTSLKYDACGVCNGTGDCVPIKPTSANLESVWFEWGIEGIDRSKADINNPFDKYLGDAVYYKDFDFHDSAAQTFIDQSLQQLEAHHELVTPGHTKNFIPTLKEWLAHAPSGPHCAYPIPPLFNTSVLLARFVIAHRTFDSCIGFDVNPLRVIWVRARMLSTVNRGLGSFDAVDIYDKYETILEERNDVAPKSTGDVHMVSELWVRVFTEVVAVNGIVYGVVVAAVVALACLAFFTGNILVAALAVVSILCNLITMLALYSLWGWSLGAIEAISVSILVGLSVDYCFHVAEAYAISQSPTREEKLADALTHMGVSVLSGAFTTVASAFFLLFCQIEIFHKFGVIVVVNTMFSLLYTFFCFGALLALVGPQGSTGNVIAIMHWCTRCFKSRLAAKGGYDIVDNSSSDGADPESGDKSDSDDAVPTIVALQ